MLPNDTLSIRCDITIIGDSNTISGRNCLQFQKTTDNSLSHDLISFFESEKGFDVILKVGNNEFKAHKSILMSRSTVFCAMFEHPMEENQSNCIEIKDFDHKVINEMLRYIYSGSVDKLDELAAELLMTANKVWADCS